MYYSKYLDYRDVPQLSDRDVAYQEENPRLRPFYSHPPVLGSFATAIEERSSTDVDRDLLVRVLKEQYAWLGASEPTSHNIEMLQRDNCFTIITAHQPSLLTGPLYFIYKICSILSLAKQLNRHYPGVHIVPVFISGGEDHDFDEIATMHLFNRDFTWSTDQSGSTGRMSLQGLTEVLEDVKATFGTMPYASELTAIIDEAMSRSTYYGRFMMHIVNQLFGKHGLVICNMDDGNFKKVLLPYVIKDIRDEVSHHCVTKDQAGLEQVGFKSQAHARDVNIFWLEDDRHRVIKEENTYRIASQTYSEDQLIRLLQANPGAISPNVILRPVYQELILPNLAYIGGGGELAYWLERKSLFETWQIPFPILVRRDSVLLVDRKSIATLDQHDLNLQDLFGREEQLIAHLARQSTDVNIDLDEYRARLRVIYEDIKNIAIQVDPTLSSTTLSEGTKAEKTIDLLEHKILRAAKQQSETKANKVIKIKHKLFPNNDSLQERYDNFIPYYLRYGDEWISALIQHLDPLNKSFKILIEQ